MIADTARSTLESWREVSRRDRILDGTDGTPAACPRRPDGRRPTGVRPARREVLVTALTALATAPTGFPTDGPTASTEHRSSGTVTR